MSNRITNNNREVISARDSITGNPVYPTATNNKLDVNATASLAGTALPIAGATTAVGVAIVDSSGNQISTFGGGTQYTDAAATVAHPIGTMPVFDNAGTISKVSNSIGLPVNIVAGGGSGGTSLADNAAFTANTTVATPISGFYHSTIDTVTDGHAAAVAIDSKRNMFHVIRDAAGNARGANVTSGNALVVDGSAVTQPISAASLPLPAGASTSAKQPALGTAGTASADVITIQGIASMTAVKVDGSGVTQPVSGTVTANAGTGNFGVNITQISGSAVATAASGIMKVGLTDGSGNAITSTSSAIDVNIKSGGGSGFSVVDEAAWTAGTSAFVPSGAVFNDSAAALTSGQQGTFRSTNNRGLHINIRNASGTELATASNPVRIDPTGTTTQPVSGTVTANIGTTNGLALDASVTGLQVSQGSTTSGQKGGLALGAVTTNAPSYTTAQTSPLSLDTSGLLRVSLKDTPANTNNLNVALAASSATVTVSGTVTTTPPSNASTNVTQWNGNTVDTNSGTKSAGTLRVVLATDQPQLTNKLLVTPDSVALPANQSVNVSQINGITPLMGNGVTGTGSQRVTIASDNTAFSVNAVQSTAAALTAGWPVATGIQTDVTGTFTNASQTTSITTGTIDGYETVTVSINGTYGTATAVFEVSDDGGTTWYSVQGARTDTATIETGYTTLSNVTRMWIIPVNGTDKFRVRSTAVASGTVNVTIAITAAATADSSTVQLGSALPTGANTIGAVTQASGPWTSNITQFGGNAVTTGTGAGGSGIPRVTVSNDSAIKVWDGTTVVSVIAGTTALKTDLSSVAGTATTTAASGTQLVGIADGTGNALTSNSTTYTAKKALDANLLGTLGTAFSTAGKIDVKGADGDVFVRQATAANLNATVVGTGTFTVQAQESGTWNVGSSTATGSAVPANAFYQGVNAQNALPSAATPGNLTGLTGDKFGRPVVLNNAFRDIMGTQTTTISSSTSETTIITQVASTFLDLVSIFISNTSATAARVDIRDTTAGSVIFQLYIPAGDMRGLSLTTPWPQTAVNTNWTAQSSASVADLRISALFIKNK